MFSARIRAALLWALIITGWVLPLRAVTAEAAAPSYPVQVSANGRYLVDQAHRPYFINGDSAWSLIVQLSKPDVARYLDDRRAKGFNAVLVELLEHRFATNAPANFYHDAPFITAGDFATPNEAYFAHADWVMHSAAASGQLVLLAPIYLGYACGPEGWCAAVRRSSLTTMRNWGRYVGKRYGALPNIVWVIGGDVDPVVAGVADKVQAFIAGLREVDSRHLITMHNVRGQSAVTPRMNTAWISLNDVYPENQTYEDAVIEFKRAPAKPIFLIESYYENEHHSTPLSLRSQAYWAVLSGSLGGHVFGNCPIWSFGAAMSFCESSRLTWQDELNSVGSRTVALVGQLFGSRAFHALVPDIDHGVMTAGYRSGRHFAATARTRDGATVIAYIPTRRRVTIDLTKVAGSRARAWWYNPRKGGFTLIGLFETTQTHTFEPPDSKDWVLVIDNASLNLPAPGTHGGVAPSTPTHLRLLVRR